MCEVVRELTFEEEIGKLEGDYETKKRLIKKWDRLVDENHKQGDYLFNCHNEIDRLNRAIVSQAKMIGNLEEEIRNFGIQCN